MDYFYIIFDHFDNMNVFFTLLIYFSEMRKHLITDLTRTIKTKKVQKDISWNVVNNLLILHSIKNVFITPFKGNLMQI